MAALLVPIAAPVATGANPHALGPATFDWPSQFCQTTLQDCINAAGDGGTVKIATNTPANESITISTSMTLESKAGFAGTILRHVAISGTGSPLKVTLRDLTVDGGVRADFIGGANHRLSLSHLLIQNNPSDLWPALTVDAEVPSRVTAIGNRFNAVNGFATQVELETGQASGLVSFTAIGNRLDGHGAATSFGGFQLLLGGHGTNRITLDNNVVRDVGGCGCIGGAGVYYRINDPATDDVNVIGNTFVGAVYGINVDVELDAGGTYGLDLFNNIIASTSNDGVIIGDFQQHRELTLRAGNNDYFHLASPNDFNTYPSGSHNLAVAPHFTSAPNGNFTLRPGSPLIDAGVVCTPGGIADPDAAGHNRLSGASTDIGAFERGAGAPGEVVLGTGHADTLLGSRGNDILCGYGGNDALTGRRGNDYLDGGTGADHLSGGPGSDRLFGRGGGDVLCGVDGVHGNDRSNGGTGHDTGRSDPGDTLISIEGSASC
jgi:RTX calcium-binding nonapeptide repeat (4 copies)